MGKRQIIIDGETAIKPYHYIRNGLLHVRYTVDRCIELSESEERSIKEALAKDMANKQSILAESWDFLVKCVGKTVIRDGVAELGRRIKEYKENGRDKKDRFKN